MSRATASERRPAWRTPFNTVFKLLLDVGEACSDYHSHVLVDLPCTTIECDEIWSFCYAKAKNVPDQHKDTFGYGDVWTWVAICADTKLVPAWLVGQRTTEDGLAFMYDLKGRMKERIQLSTDGHQAYRGSVPYAFDPGDVDWAQIHKIYKSQQVAPGRYSPPACTGTKVTVRLGDPDPSRISTSYVERQNLTMRMGMRRSTRLQEDREPHSRSRNPLHALRLRAPAQDARQPLSAHTSNGRERR